jgi:hypothetical protein
MRGFEHRHLAWSANANEIQPLNRENVVIPTVEAMGLEPTNLLTASHNFGRSGGFSIDRYRRSTRDYCPEPFRPVQRNPSPLLTQLLTF